MSDRSYLELFMKNASNRDKIQGFFQDLIREGLIPERIETGFFGITVSRDDVTGRFFTWIKTADDAMLAKIAECGKRRFS